MSWSDTIKAEEKNRLDKVADWFRLEKGMYANTTRWTTIEVLRLARGKRCLELGCADGLMTTALEQHFDQVVSVDASEEYVERTRARVSQKTRVIHAFFEELELDERFETVVLSHVLEHVLDPVTLIASVKKWIAPGGVLIVVVPNANSLHRLAAVEMGLLSSVHELNSTDQKLGHRRVYSPEMLRADIEAAGYTVGQTGGIFLKVLSNAQLEAQWTPEMIEAYYKLGFLLPQHGAEIYAECLPT